MIPLSYVCSPVNVREQVLHSYKTGKIIVLYIYVFMILDCK